ncbi:MAG: hypothetical protein KF708_18420 [Pirellulales bacterium]|nr:hypothetical protein [Pirellulales bacterium]
MFARHASHRLCLVVLFAIALGCGPNTRRDDTLSLHDMIGHEVSLSGTLRGPGEFGTILNTPLGQVYLVGDAGIARWTADRNLDKTIYTVTGILLLHRAGEPTDSPTATAADYYYFEGPTTKVEVAEGVR